jgi:carbon monoxide dehydrogenase subunit G
MRVEDVEEDAFTEVMRTAKGKSMRADFRLLETDAQAHSLIWEQQLEGTPFARVLKEARTRVSLQEADGGTRVTIELEQKLNGFFPRFGGFMVRRAAQTTLDEALDGLERIGG